MLIGAYRDNEVDRRPSADAQARRHQAAPAERWRRSRLRRSPAKHLGQLIADALHCEPERAAPLAQLVHEKTGGNPFFAIQFLTSLAEEGLLAFDHDAACWSWDLERIHAKGYTDNVVDLMVGKLDPPAARNAGGIAATRLCRKRRRDSRRLRSSCGTSEDEVHAALWEAVRTGLVERLAGRIQVRPRSSAGSRLFVDPGGATRRGASSHRETACGEHCAGAD